ncbi:hypothetical protein EDC04DRAFT_2886843 [Pisolithus marmoratus]|nr:hypothetical protein EDC04DRAFT_2886843 [Pisolithus marmoratus]
MSYPTSMYAITIAKTGGPEVMEKTEVPFPVVEPGHLVVKMDYAGVNFVDIYFRYRKEFTCVMSPFHLLVGKEGAGTVIGLPTDPAVRDDPEYQKRGYEIGSRVALDQLGTYAEYVSMPWRTAYPVSDSIPARVAAAALMQGVTTISFMEEAYAVKKGDSTKEKAEFAKKNGANHVILYKDEDTVARVLEITNGEGVHAIFDGVGKDTFESDFRMIRRKGTLVSVGNASGAVPPFPPLKLVEKNMKLVRPTMVNYAYTPSEVLYYADALCSYLSNGTLKPFIHKEYAFTTEGVREAHTDLNTGKTIGKLLIKISA